MPGDIDSRTSRKWFRYKGLTDIAGWICGTNLVCSAMNISHFNRGFH
jgi:hypothetical protein